MKEIKRFYKKAHVESGPEVHYVCLDGRRVKTPAKADLAVPTVPLATAIAEEWDRQEETVMPKDMPLTTLACTAIDHVAKNRAKAVEETAAFGQHDLLCYWAEGQDDLIERQRQHWQPLLDWAAESLGARLIPTTGILPQDQPPAALSALLEQVEACDDLQLAALNGATQAAGSLVIGLALVKGRLSHAAAFEVSQLDETYQNELWGQDREAMQRRAALRSELAVAAKFLELLASD